MSVGTPRPARDPSVRPAATTSFAWRRHYSSAASRRLAPTMAMNSLAAVHIAVVLHGRYYIHERGSSALQCSRAAPLRGVTKKIIITCQSGRPAKPGRAAPIRGARRGDDHRDRVRHAAVRARGFGKSGPRTPSTQRSDTLRCPAAAMPRGIGLLHRQHFGRGGGVMIE